MAEDASGPEPPQASVRDLWLAILMFAAGVLLLLFCALALVLNAGNATCCFDIVSISVEDGECARRTLRTANYVAAETTSILGIVGGVLVFGFWVFVRRRFSLRAALAALLLIGLLGALPFLFRAPGLALDLRFQFPPAPAEAYGRFRESLQIAEIERAMGPDVLDALGAADGLPIAELKLPRTLSPDRREQSVSHFTRLPTEKRRIATERIVSEIVVARLLDAWMRHRPDAAVVPFRWNFGDPSDPALIEWRKRVMSDRTDMPEAAREVLRGFHRAQAPVL